LKPGEKQPGWTVYKDLEKESTIKDKNVIQGWFGNYNLKKGYFHCLNPMDLTST